MRTEKLTSPFNSAADKAPRGAVPGFVPEKDSFDVLQSFEEAGFGNIVLHGGALRDDYLRNVLGHKAPTKDYDIVAEIDPSIFQGKTEFDEATALLKEYIERKFPGALIHSAGVNFSKDGRFSGGADFTDSSGRRIDLTLHETGRNPQTLAERITNHRDNVSGDAPLSRIAMDVQGILYCDVLFEQHARQGIYRPDSPIPDHWLKDDPRLNRMKEKIPGLRYIPPDSEDAPIQVLAGEKKHPERRKPPHPSAKTSRVPTT